MASVLIDTETYKITLRLITIKLLEVLILLKNMLEIFTNIQLFKKLIDKILGLIKFIYSINLIFLI